jgi:two-component system chemotaxis response regulator CheY
MRILIAEDDDGSRMMLEAAVRHLGHEFVSARDGLEAWRLYQDAKADAVISDRSMPTMDGFELCKRIRALPGSGYSYFIFLTAHSDRSGIRDGIEVGADDYLGKPLDLEELSARLTVAARLTDLHRRLETEQSKLEALNEQLFAQTRMDPLTQVGSRRKLSEDLERITARVERYGERYCAVMCDVDHFKLFNDTYGHPAGDRVLHSVARALVNSCRSADQVYRYGGEEFLLILPNQSLDGGRIGAERLRSAVEALNIAHDASPAKKVTVSVGLAVLNASEENTIARWLEDADAALYRAKSAGRNRVMSARVLG